MIDHRTAPYAALVLRVSLGVMYIAHSLVLKHFMYTLPGTAQFFASIGLPAALAYLTFWGELVGGVALVAGIGTRIVALGLIPILLGATWVHAGNGWVFSAANGGWEYPVFLIAASGGRRPARRRPLRRFQPLCAQHPAYHCKELMA